MPTKYFLPGQTNLIAVLLQNTWESDWDNVAFDVALKGVSATPPTIPQFLSTTRNLKSYMGKMADGT